MTKEQMIKVWENFTINNNFKLNPDGDHVSFVADGVLDLENKYGLKLCPCRLRDGSREQDLKLICPCNFTIQETWKKEGRCWCGLFVKK